MDTKTALHYVDCVLRCREISSGEYTLETLGRLIKILY